MVEEEEDEKKENRAPPPLPYHLAKVHHFMRP